MAVARFVVRRNKAAERLMNPSKIKAKAISGLSILRLPCATGIPWRLSGERTGPNDLKVLQPVIEKFGEDAIKAELQQISAELKMALDAALDAPVWAWNGGARDIYDTGALKASGTVEIRGLEIIVRYSAPYATLVHNGGYIYPYGNKSAQPIFLPGRPWVRSVLYGGGPVPQFDFVGAIQRAFPAV